MLSGKSPTTTDANKWKRSTEFGVKEVKTKTKERHIVFLSGGKDSTAMLLMMLERGMRVDEIIFVDTGLEFSQMYEHIQKIETYVKENYGKTLTILKPEKPFEYYLLRYKKTRGKYKDRAGYGWPRLKVRWCTGRLKLDPIHRHLRRYKDKYTVIQYVGLAFDERTRMRDDKKKRYPLIDWRITEEQALKYCYAKGFDFGGLYTLFCRVSCWLCPFRSLSELKVLYDHFPDLWEKLRELEKLTWNKFRADYSVDDLEMKWIESEGGRLR